MMKPQRRIDRSGITVAENTAALALIAALISMIGPWTATAWNLERIAERSRLGQQEGANLAARVEAIPSAALDETVLGKLAEEAAARISQDDPTAWQITAALADASEPNAKLKGKRITIRLTHETGSPPPIELVVWRHFAENTKEAAP